MASPAFYAPKNIAELLELLDRYREKACMVNGGTDIVEKINNNSVNPEAIVYIQNVSELNYIREQDGHVCIGGVVSYKALEESALCRQFGGLQQAMAEIGSPPIRVVATPAGNIGTAVPAGDCTVALLALNASFVLRSKNGQRTVPAEEMFTGVGKTLLQPGELISEIRIPVNAAAKSAFVKLAKRKAQDIAQVSTCVCLETRGNVCASVRIGLGAVASRPVRAVSLEKLLTGKTPDEIAAALKGALPAEASLRSPRNKAYKESVISVIVGRALQAAWSS